MKELQQQPLISVLIFTYNSAKFIIETLESTRAQTYDNIELIITDDHSLDNTVDLCLKWVEANRNRFARTEIITGSVNSGIPANINRGLSACKGIWVKYIAGDDILTETCLSDYFSYINSSEEDVSIISADIIKFFGEYSGKGEIKRNPFDRFTSKEITAQEQAQMLLRTNMVFSSTVIIRRDLLVMTGGFDESYRLLEDWPYWLKITLSGIKMHYLAKPVVYYRIHDNNISHTTKPTYVCHPVNRIAIDFKQKEIIPRLPYIEKLGLKHEMLGVRICFLMGNNRKNPLTRTVYAMFNLLNPFFTYLRLLKIFGIRYRYADYI